MTSFPFVSRFPGIFPGESQLNRRWNLPVVKEAPPVFIFFRRFLSFQLL